MAKKIMTATVVIIMSILLVFLAGCGDSNVSRMSAEKFAKNKAAIEIETRESWHILNNKSADTLKEYWGEISDSYIYVSFSQEEGAKIEFIALVVNEKNYTAERTIDVESEYATYITLAVLNGVDKIWVGDEKDGFMLYIPDYLRECSFEYDSESERIVLKK